MLTAPFKKLHIPPKEVCYPDRSNWPKIGGTAKAKPIVVGGSRVVSNLNNSVQTEKNQKIAGQGGSMHRSCHPRCYKNSPST